MKEEKENIYININKQIIEKIYMATYLPMCMWMPCIMKMWGWFKALIFFKNCFGQFFDNIFSPKNYWIFTTKI